MRFAGPSALLVLLVLLAMSVQLTACTKQPGDDSETNSTDGESTSGETGSETGSDACDAYVDAAADPPLQLVVSNSRPEPVYLMTANDCTFNHIHITSDVGHWPPSDCEPTCAQMIAGNCACPGACAAPLLLRIEAGSSHMLDWPFVLAPDNVPDTCIDPTLCGSGACPQAIVPPSGAYTISADVVYAPAECEGVGDPCACPPGESSCVTSVIYGDAPDLELDFPTELPGGSLELVIE